jgi:hypothetical protein
MASGYTDELTRGSTSYRTHLGLHPKMIDDETRLHLRTGRPIGLRSLGAGVGSLYGMRMCGRLSE